MSSPVHCEAWILVKAHVNIRFSHSQLVYVLLGKICLKSLLLIFYSKSLWMWIRGTSRELLYFSWGRNESGSKNVTKVTLSLRITQIIPKFKGFPMLIQGHAQPIPRPIGRPPADKPGPNEGGKNSPLFKQVPNTKSGLRSCEEEVQMLRSLSLWKNAWMKGPKCGFLITVTPSQTETKVSSSGSKSALLPLFLSQLLFNQK